MEKTCLHERNFLERHFYRNGKTFPEVASMGKSLDKSLDYYTDKDVNVKFPETKKSFCLPIQE